MALVFITGGARRIGRGLAIRFAAKGWDVGVVYNTSEDAAISLVEHLTSLGVKAKAVKADVADNEQVTTALNHLQATLGLPDVVVSNAGVFPPQRPIDSLTLADLRATMAVNTEPLFSIAAWLYSVIPENHPAVRLIAMSSLGAFEIWKDRMDYNMSKSALVNLVRSLSRAMAPKISVNSVAPGAIVVPGEETSADVNLVPTSKIPMGRYGTSDDIFDAVFFFATSTPYITGQILVVDGGYQQVR